jgi:hypothetical protein
MRKLLLVVIIAALAYPLGAAARPADLKAQLARLTEWWPGRYDNYEQIVRQSGGGLSDTVETPFHRLHTVVRAVKGSALGDSVFYVEDYAHGDEVNAVRKELYVVAIDEPTAVLRVRRQALPAGPGVRAEGPVEASGLGAAKPLPQACDILLSYIGGQFEGGLASAKCPAPGEGPDYRVVVGERFQWVRQRTAAPGAAYGWFEQTRARMFTCSVHEDAAGQMRDTRYFTSIRLHDQGGAADIAWPDGRTLTFTIHTRAFTSPPSDESPLFRIHEKGKTVPIAYAYASAGATRFGLNLGWFYIRCYAEGHESPFEPPVPPAK